MRDLLEMEQMIRGKFVIGYRRCGTRTCWCASAEIGHPQNRIVWGENAKNFTKAIPKKEIPWIKIMTTNYKSFRTARKRIRDINEEVRILLNELEAQIVTKTRKRRKYLTERPPD